MKPLLTLFAFAVCLNATHSQTYNYYYGNLHAHTSYSDGNQDSATSMLTKPIQAFNYANASQHIDFYGISEHNHASAGMKSLAAFHQGIADANAATVNGSFVAMYGMEWGVISGGGHVMIYGTDSLIGWDSGLFNIYVPQNNYTTLWDKLVVRPSSFAYLCHPTSTDYGGILTASVNAIADSVIVGMAGRSGPAFSTNSTYSNPSTSNYIVQYNMALAQGYHVGIGLDHDTHNSVFGRSQQGRLVVLAQSLTRAHVYDAMKKMRFYCSDDWNAQVNFQMLNQPMGSIITHSGVPTMSVSVTDLDGTETVSSIAIYHGITGSGTNPTLLTTITNTANMVYTHTGVTNNSKHYYYLLITQGDGNKIYTSPIWYNRNDAYVSAAPVANFTQSTNNACINKAINFTDISSNAPTSWTWTANGATSGSSNLQNPSFIFTSAGTHTVTLIVANSTGASSIFSKTISVLPLAISPTITSSGITLTSSGATGYQWYVNGSLIPGATSQNYNTTFNGSFYVVATSSVACNSAPSNAISILDTGIETQQVLNETTIYPNPTNGEFTIEMNVANAQYELEIYNEMGLLVFQKKVLDCPPSCMVKINMSEFANGIYTLKSSIGAHYKFQKIVLDKQ